MAIAVDGDAGRFAQLHGGGKLRPVLHFLVASLSGERRHSEQNKRGAQLIFP